MAELSGKNGKVDISGAVNGINRWACDYVGDILETTDFGDSGHKTYIAGADGWSGTIEGNFNQETLETIMGSAATLKLYVNATKYITGTAIISGWHLNTSAEGLVTVAYDFTGSDAIDLTNLV